MRVAVNSLFSTSSIVWKLRRLAGPSRVAAKPQAVAVPRAPSQKLLGSDVVHEAAGQRAQRAMLVEVAGQRILLSCSIDCQQALN